MEKKVIIILTVSFLLFTPSIFAEMIVLKSGKTVEGKILERADKNIKVDIAGIPITYYLDEIESIDGKKMNPLPLPEAGSNEAEESLLSQKNKALTGQAATSERQTWSQEVRIVSDDPASTVYMHTVNQANDYVKQGQYGKAVEQYEAALKIKPDASGTYVGLAAALIGLKKYDEAIRICQKALQINPQEEGAYLNLGNAYENQGNFEQAISAYNKLIEVNANLVNAYFNRGNAYVRQNDITRAISDFTKAIELDPRHGGAYISRSVSYFIKKDYDKAWEDVHTAESLGYKANPNFLNDLKNASGRKK